MAVDLKAAVNAAEIAAYEAGKIVQSARRLNEIKSSKKAKGELVTEFDKRSESIILEVLRSYFPDHNFITEENGLLVNNPQSPYTWLIDPIDGTNNFIHKNPNYCISIALTFKEVPVCGVIFEPNANNLFKAESGKGAFMNDKRLKQLNRTYSSTLISSSTPKNSTNKEALSGYFKVTEYLMQNGLSQRSLGSASLELAYLAAGYTDAYYGFNLKAWDIAAGVLIAKEAGAIISDFRGGETYLSSGQILAASTRLHPLMLKILNNFIP